MVAEQTEGDRKVSLSPDNRHSTFGVRTFLCATKAPACAWPARAAAGGPHADRPDYTFRIRGDIEFAPRPHVY